MSRNDKPETGRALWIYLRTIDGIPELPAEEEERLAAAAATGDPGARRRLARGYLRLVARIALDRWRPGREPLLLIRAGHRGLLRAAESYQPGAGIGFREHAASGIESAIVSVSGERSSASRGEA